MVTVPMGWGMRALSEGSNPVCVHMCGHKFIFIAIANQASAEGTDLVPKATGCNHVFKIT